MKMFKNIFLMLAVNLGIMITLSLVLSLIGANRYITAQGLDYNTLAVFCLVWGMGASFISLLLSKTIARWVYGVQIVDPANAGQVAWVYDMVARASVSAGLPKIPEVGIYESPEMNAFATGPTRSRALVAVSTGLLRSMSKEEVEGVIGHEVTHIANGDMITMTLLQGVMNALVMFVARIIAYAATQAGRRDERGSGNGMMYYVVMHVSEMVLGIAGMMVVNWFSRRREFRADAGSAQIFGKRKMISALQALHDRSRGVVDPRGQNLATFKISGGRAWMRFLSTHPPLEERIAALQQSGV